MESETLSGLGAARLTDRLKDRLGSVGGLAVESERELARELVRRARREERLWRALSRLLAVVEALGLHQWAGSRPGHPVPKEVVYGLSLTERQAQELRAAAQEGRRELGSPAELPPTRCWTTRVRSGAAFMTSYPQRGKSAGEDTCASRGP